jgi:nucleotide-binding universal stress UspA family protein
MIVLRNVLVATDFSPPSQTALIYGRALARTFGATLTLLHVSDNFFLRPVAADPHDLMAAKARMLDELVLDEDRRAVGGARPVLEVSDSPAQTIADYARTHAIDLIVIGTHGRTARSQLLLGSVAERMVRIAPCPVLTVRHPEHEFVLPDTSEQRGRHDSPEHDSRRN